MLISGACIPYLAEGYPRGYLWYLASYSALILPLMPTSILAGPTGIFVRVLVDTPSATMEDQAQTSLFQALCHLSELASLKLDRLETTHGPVHSKRARLFTPAMSLTGQLANLLPAASGGSLTSLSIHGHHLLESDVSCCVLHCSVHNPMYCKLVS